ncbi:MAG: hypothetical protein M0007_07600 [Actinomycetota bacterium]|jgi:hypothetical protein|nr:hypothetical protein [Actinomycetota bacterium]
MSTTPTRQPAGVPTGGQFAAKSNPECGVDLEPVTPRWGPELDSAIQVGIQGLTRRWIAGDLAAPSAANHLTVEMLEVLDIDEDEAVRLYGEERGSWLSRLDVDIESSKTQSPAVLTGPLAGPAEEQTVGTVEIRGAENGQAVLSATFSEEDLPEVVGLLANYRPARLTA